MAEVTKDQENKALMETFEQREAGVADLFEFYTKVEAVYAAATQALQEGTSVMASDSTNLR